MSALADVVDAGDKATDCTGTDDPQCDEDLLNQFEAVGPLIDYEDAGQPLVIAPCSFHLCRTFVTVCTFPNSSSQLLSEYQS